MSLISQLLPLSNVVVDLDASSKKRVFEQAGLLFENNQGIAIPHGRIKGLKDAAGAFLRLAAPVQFDAPDGRPVSMLFVLLVPEQANETHLQLLSELAQMFSDRVFREALQNAPDATHIHQMFMTWGADAADQRSTAV